MRELWRRLSFLFDRNRFESDLDDEMRFHLKMKACAFKLFRAGQKRLSKLAAFQDDLIENRGEQAMDARVELIEKDHSTARQKTRHEFAECRCVGILRRVRFVENPSELGSEGSVESRGGRADDRLD